MRRVIGLLVVAVLLALSVSAAPGAAAPTENKADCTSGLGDQLAKEATYVERNTKTKAGAPVDRIYHTVYGIDADGRATRIAPVHYGGAHATESAYTPASPYGHLYFADMSILHWISDPCSEGDTYAYAVNVGCADADTFAPTGCLFDAWAGLQTKDVFGGSWDTTWGLSHRKNASSRASCYADGTPHQIADYAYKVRTWLYLDGTFTAPSPDWPFNSRKSTSKEMLTGESHTLNNGPCWPDWCDAAGPPDGSAGVVFDSCVTV